MRENNICSKAKKKFKMTTDSKHKIAVADNLLQRGLYLKQSLSWVNSSSNCSNALG